MPSDGEPDGFREDQARFRAALDFAAYFGNYNYRCVFTGDDLRHVVDRDPRSALLYLTPSRDLRADLILPACRDSQEAFRRLEISVADNLDLLVNINTCPRALRDRLLPRLLLPQSADYAPNRLVLADHARAFIGS